MSNYFTSTLTVDSVPPEKLPEDPAVQEFERHCSAVLSWLKICPGIYQIDLARRAMGSRGVAIRGKGRSDRRIYYNLSAHGNRVFQDLIAQNLIEVIHLKNDEPRYYLKGAYRPPRTRNYSGPALRVYVDPTLIDPNIKPLRHRNPNKWAGGSGK